MTSRSVREYAAALAPRYRAASRPQRSQLLDEAERVTGYHRKSLIRVLADVERPPRRRSGRPRQYVRRSLPPSPGCGRRAGDWARSG